MSAVQEQIDRHQLSAKGARFACVAEAPCKPIPGGTFGRLCNEKQVYDVANRLFHGHGEYILQ